MQGRIRQMTASAQAYAHALHNVCLGRLAGVFAIHNSRLVAPKTNSLQLRSVRTTTRLTGAQFRGWAIFTDGGTHTIDEETTAGWSAVARSPRGVCHVMFWASRHY